MQSTFYVVAFVAGFVEICPPNWPFRWRGPVPPPTWRLGTDFLAGIAGIGGGVVTQRLVGGDSAVVLLATVAVAVIAGGAVRQVASYLGPTPQPAADGINVPKIA